MKLHISNRLKILFADDKFYIFLLLLLSPLFFYRLGFRSLVSFDEAWYAAIAKHIVLTKSPFDIEFNGLPFLDHPPFGFWLMALSFVFVGFTNFAARLPSATAGILSMILVYFLGKELFNKRVGFLSALALPSAPWFLFRARSGDLDSLLTCFFIASVYFAVLACRKNKMLPLLSLSLIFLFLTKTAVPFSIIPVIIFIALSTKNLRIIRHFIITLLVAYLVIGIWIFFQIHRYPMYLNRYFSIGTPGLGTGTDFPANIILLKTYIHNGIGKWFWPGILGIFTALVSLKRRFYTLVFFILPFLFPFFFSEKGQLWHYIPVFPFFILIFIASTDYYSGLILTIFKRIGRKLNIKFFYSQLLNFLPGLLLSLFVLYLSFLQIKQNWYQFIAIPAYISDEEILGKEAGKYSEPLLVDGDFVQSVSYYSGKTIQKIQSDNLRTVFTDNSSFVMITNSWRLNEGHINANEYQLIAADRDKVLIRKLH